MANPWNAAIAYDNRADRASITASSSAILLPVSRLQDPHIARKWRSNGSASEFLTIDLGASVPVDTVALIGLNLTSDGTVRVRVSDMDTSAQAGEIYDSGDVGGAIDPRWGMLVHLLPEALVGRYVRIDLSDPNAAYIEAGRLFVGRRWQFQYNFAFGWSRQYVDRSRKTESRGGQTFIDRDVRYRMANISFELITQAQRWGFVEEVDRVNGTHDDVLLITQSDSDNLGRDCIWGLISDLDPITQPQVWIEDAPAYAKAYRITERL